MPGVSTPVSWEELEAWPTGSDGDALAFTPADVLERVDELGDLYADSLAGDQELPSSADPHQRTGVNERGIARLADASCV